MKIDLKKIKISDIYEGYNNPELEPGNEDVGDEAIVGFNGKLTIRPIYQRNFIYNEKEQKLVMDTIIKGYPLNVMYWVKNSDGHYELLDGQQRILSFCSFLAGDYSIELTSGQPKYFHNLAVDIRQKILDYELMVYICEGTDTEKIEWFNTINIAGKQLNEQERLNAIYRGEFTTAAKRFFSKRNGPAANLGKRYIVGDPNRQDYLAKTIKWINNNDVAGYMNAHQDKPNANELVTYFKSVIDWVEILFTQVKYRKEMKGVEWGELYNKYHNNEYDAKELEKEIFELMKDPDVENKKGIYYYVFDRDVRHLNIRAFDENIKREVYEKQKGICPHCHEHFEYEEMEGDHITPFTEGGHTTIDNCQMLCRTCNRKKGAN